LWKHKTKLRTHKTQRAMLVPLIGPDRSWLQAHLFQEDRLMKKGREYLLGLTWTNFSVNKRHQAARQVIHPLMLHERLAVLRIRHFHLAFRLQTYHRQGLDSPSATLRHLLQKFRSPLGVKALQSRPLSSHLAHL